MQSIRRATALTRNRRSRWIVLFAVLTLLVSAELTDIASAAPRTAGKHHPVGLLGTVRQSSKGVFVRGWAYDGDTKAPAKVKIRLDGKTVKATTAHLYRPSIAKKHPSYGTHRGFRYEGAISSGKHKVCAYVVDYPSQHKPLLGCKTVTFASSQVTSPRPAGRSILTSRRARARSACGSTARPSRTAPRTAPCPGWPPSIRAPARTTATR
jgi:hypothetical protein